MNDSTDVGTCWRSTSRIPPMMHWYACGLLAAIGFSILFSGSKVAHTASTQSRITGSIAPSATPNGEEAPYGIGVIAPQTGVSADEMEEMLAFLPSELAGLTQRQTSSNHQSATVIYVDDEDPNAPRFGVLVALKVPGSTNADDVIAGLQRERWGNPEDHDLTAMNDGRDGQPAFREFSRSFAPGQFALPNRPVYFLLWYRAGDDYAFMVIGDSPPVREALTRAVATELQS